MKSAVAFWEREDFVVFAHYYGGRGFGKIMYVWGCVKGVRFVGVGGED